MATATATKEFVFEWEGRDRNGKTVRGETRAGGENQVMASLRRQGVSPLKIKKRKMRSGARIKPKDIAIFTRQLATMMKAGVPLLQAFDIVGRGNANPSVTQATAAAAATRRACVTPALLRALLRDDRGKVFADPQPCLEPSSTRRRRRTITTPCSTIRATMTMRPRSRIICSMTRRPLISTASTTITPRAWRP